MIIQEFMLSSDFDIRTFCVDNKIFASTKRTHSSYDFRSNTHRGVRQNHILSKEEKELVLKALLEFLRIIWISVDHIIHKGNLTY